MKAMVIHSTGDLRVEERKAEKAGANQVLTQTAAASVCDSNLHDHRHGGFGTVKLHEPRVLGRKVSARR